MIRQSVGLGAALLLLLSACGYGVASTGAPSDPYFEGVSSTLANAGIRDAQDRVIGLATLRETRLGVLVVVTTRDLPPGAHGIHIHAAGKCDKPDFATAGGHFNPNATQHGFKNPKGPHAGDLPNLIVGQDGRGSLSYVHPHLSLEPGASNSLLLGTSIVIHANADDEQTDPAGNSGGRIACGIITKSG